MKKYMTTFDEEKGDVSLFLVRFEGQAKALEILEENWVTQLMTLLPTESNDLITRECREDLYNYERVKKLLLEKYKLNPEQFRQKLYKHQRNPDGTWKDFTYEMQNYLNEWVNGLEVTTFEGFKDLILTDQVKRRVNNEAKDHFIDEWDTIISAKTLADRLDKYEINRGYRKLASKENKEFKRPDKTKKGDKIFPKKEKNSVKEQTERRSHHSDRGQRSNGQSLRSSEEWFERRHRPQCYECGSYDHFRPQCPKLVKKPSTSINRIQEMKEEDVIAPFMTVAEVNGIELPLLRDTGANIDLISRNYIKPEMFTGETVWVKQPLDEALICLPIAKIHLKGKFGDIDTKAAVVRSELDEGRYLMGNRTAALLSTDILPTTIAAVQTRSQTRPVEKEKTCLNAPGERLEEAPEVDQGENTDDLEENDTDSLLLPAVDLTNQLVNVNHEEFIKAQNESEDLKSLFKKVENTNIVDSSKKEYYTLENKVLVKCLKNKQNEFQKLIIVPEPFREQIKILCHEGTSGHFGVKKSKSRLSRYYFWPNCHKEMETFVKTCDACQRVGGNNDRKKAPMVQVPVIAEVFSKINIDACGPLPKTTNGNRYMITAICMTSKYPEAIPVPDISSKSVIDALLKIFSRIGFPKEIQCDQGTSFMSELTTTFFKKLGITVKHSSVYHPQSNPVERFHRTLKKILRTVCKEAGSDWENILPQALFAIRTVTHESTGFSPAELVHGKNLRTPETLIYEQWINLPEEQTLVTEYVFNLINRLKLCQDIAIKNMEELSRRNKKWYDRNAVKREFKIGDSVLILATSRINKLTPQWVGPGTIVSKVSDTNYVVKLNENSDKTQLYHVNMIKPYYKRPDMLNLLWVAEEEGEPPPEELELVYLHDLNTT